MDGPSSGRVSALREGSRFRKPARDQLSRDQPEYGTLTIAWRWYKQYGESIGRIFKRRSGRSYRNGKLDVLEQSQRVGDRNGQ
jgi:hypothetical protein